MPAVRVNLVGRFFGRLVVRKLAQVPGRSRWTCECSCGEVTTVSGGNLQSGSTNSCGCLRREVLDKTTHGLSGRPEYNVWKNMIERCTNPSAQNFEHYGGRGISVCKRWLDVTSFLIDMGPCPTSKTLGRKDNDGNYEPSNCSWEDHEDQANNKRTTRRLTHNGRTQSMPQWAREKGMPVETLFARLKHRSVFDALEGTTC